MQKKFSSLFVILAGTCWGTSGIFVRLFNELGLYAMQIATVRTIFSALIFAILIFIKDRNLFKIRLKDIWYFMGAGFFGIALFNFCYYETIEVSSLSIAAILLYTAPIFVMIFSVPLFGEKLTGRKLTSLALSFSGCIMVSGVLTGGAAGLTGEAFVIGIVSGISYAFYTIFSKYAVARGYSGMTVTFYSFVLALIPCMIMADYEQIITSVESGGAVSVMLMIAFSVFTSLIPNLSYVEGLKYVETGKASIMSSIETVMATLFGLILFKEMPTVWGISGMCLVVTSIVLLNLKTKQDLEEILDVVSESAQP